ncbi:hypothetical protein ScPMuIL_015497 [Solemya velum]
MGCTPSSSPTNSKTNRNRRLNSLHERQRRVSIDIGQSVVMNDVMPKVVFVFGGPGTKKGRIVSDLVQSFGFKLINVENMIQEEFSKQLEDPDPEKLTMAVHQMIKNEPDILRLNWVMRKMVYMLDEMDQNQVYLIDFMPNLKFLLNNDTFIKDCSTDFRFFESKYPVTFAMNFVIPAEKLKQKVETECAKHPGKPKDQPSAQSDEADFSRTQKRATVFQNSVQHFLDYFNKSNRVVTVDVSCGELDSIWYRVCEFFCELHFKPQCTINNVILFHFGEDYIKEGINDYEMETLVLKDLVDDPNDAMEKLVQSLCRCVDNTQSVTRTFTVDCSGTAISKQSSTSIQKQVPVFLEAETSDIHKFVSSVVDAPEPIKVKAFSSLDNEFCLFPSDTDPLLCCWLVRTMKTCREL